MIYLAEIAPDNRYINCIEVALVIAEIPAPTEPANVLVQVAAPPASFAGASPTEVLYLVDGVEQWIETASLAELQARKSAEITQQRIATDSDHFTYPGADGQSLSIRTADKDMFDLLIADARISKGGMPANWPGGWKAIENSYVPIATVDEWNAFFIAMYDAGIDNFNRSQQLKARISAATTPEEVAAISWDMDLT